LIPLVGLCFACANFDRSPESGYAGQKPRSSRVLKSRSTTPLPMKEVNLSTRTRLKQLENSLSTRQEMEQYSKALPWFHNEEERIQFLSLPGFEDRQKWLTKRDFNARGGQIRNEMRELVEVQDI